MGSLATAATFVGNGLGFAWLPRTYIIEREPQSGQLKPPPPSQGGVEPSLPLHQQGKEPLGPASQILLECSSRSPNVAAQRALRGARTGRRVNAQMPDFPAPATKFLVYDDHPGPTERAPGPAAATVSSSSDWEYRLPALLGHYRLLVPDLRGPRPLRQKRAAATAWPASPRTARRCSTGSAGSGTPSRWLG